MTEPLLWVVLGALVVQAALFYAKGVMNQRHFWVALGLLREGVRTALRIHRRVLRRV